MVSPEVSVAYRFALASLVLFGWCAVRRTSLSFRTRQHLSFLLFGILQFALNYVLLYLAERAITSGLLAVIFVLVLAWNVLGARIFFGTPLPLRLLAGATLGMLGVALMSWPEVVRAREQAGLLGLFLGVLASLSASAGNLWAQRACGRKISVVPSTAWAMLYASLAVVAHCFAQGLAFTLDFSIAYLASLAYLAVFGSVFAFVCYLTLLQRVGSGPAGYTAAVIPALAMLASTVFEGYRWSRLTVFGMCLVLAGSVWVMRERQRIALRG